MTTRIHKEHDGWNAETSIDLENQRVLKLRTGKRSIGGGLQTTATVWTDTGDGGLTHAMGLGTGSGKAAAATTGSVAGNTAGRAQTESAAAMNAAANGVS